MEEIGPYRIVRWLGRGGMGTVFEAVDTVLGRRVALKLIAEEYADDPVFRARFVREARAQAALDSPHVVQVFAHGEAGGRLFLASQLVPDGDLGAELRRHGPLPWPEAVALVAQVADGLAEAHRVGLVHRDIKPSNVLLRRRGTHTVAYLADFGIAAPAGHDGSGVAADLAATVRLLRTCLGGHPGPAGLDVSSAAALRDSLRAGPLPMAPRRHLPWVAAAVLVAVVVPAGVQLTRGDAPDPTARLADALAADAGLDRATAACAARALASYDIDEVRDLPPDAVLAATARCLWPADPDPQAGAA